MTKISVFALAMGFFMNAWAEPEQLDVVGIVPGVTTQAELEEKLLAGKNDVLSEWGELPRVESRLVIGGFILSCAYSEYDTQGRLERFRCFTGHGLMGKYRFMFGANSYDMATGKSVSNSDVHEALLSGYTEKYGSPTSERVMLYENEFAYFDSQPSWIDKSGNQLSLMKTYRNDREGLLLLQSSEMVKILKEKQKKADDELKRKQAEPKQF